MRHGQAVRSIVCSRRGFNLVEAAIILGVIGLVIGGIWIAASRVSSQLKAQRTTAAVISMSVAARNLYAGLPWPDSTDDNSTTNLNLVMMRAGVIPADWTNGSIITSPYGYDPAASSKNGVAAGLVGTQERIVIQVSGNNAGPGTGASPAECNWLVGTTAARLNAEPSFYGFQITSNVTTVWFLKPVDFANVSCPQDISSIRWWFDR